jgi:Zn-dependent protease
LPNIDFVQVLISFLVLLFSLTVHEAAHAWSADRLGDATARMLGRVSLNPAVHVDPIGTVLFPLIALLTNLPVIGWAKPVPVNILNLRSNWREKYMVIAAAGPASNIVLAVIASLVLRAIAPTSADALERGQVSVVAPLATVLVLATSLNLLLALFNMLPVPPLDGGNVLAGMLRGPVGEAFERLRPYGFLILYALMLTGVLTEIIVPPWLFLRSLLM